MSMSVDLDVDSVESMNALLDLSTKEMSKDLEDVFIGALRVELVFQTRTPASWWSWQNGDTFTKGSVSKILTYEQEVKALKDDEQLAVFVKIVKELAPTISASLIQMIASIHPEETPTFVSTVCPMIRKELATLDDRSVALLYCLYSSNFSKLTSELQQICELKDEKKQTEKVNALVQTIQEKTEKLLKKDPSFPAAVKQKIENTSDLELFKHAQSLVRDGIPLMSLIINLAFILNSETPEDRHQHEAAKVADCFKKAIEQFEKRPGDKHLSACKIDVRFAKLSDLDKPLTLHYHFTRQADQWERSSCTKAVAFS